MKRKAVRCKLGENLPAAAAEVLKQAGHDATTVYEQALSGVSDARLSTICRDEERALVTLDLDFADIRSYPPGEYTGLIVLRLTRQDLASILAIITKISKLLLFEKVENSLWIVEANRVRIRR